MTDDRIDLVQEAMAGIESAFTIDDPELLEISSYSFTFRGVRYLLQLTELRSEDR